MNVVRINSAHASLEGAQKIVDNVRAVSDKIGILVDTKGPEVRLTAMENPEGFEVRQGDWLEIHNGPDKLSRHPVLYTSYGNFVSDVPVGSHVLIDDGELELEVMDKKDNTLFCEVRNDATLGSRKSVNVPGVRINLPSLTEKDINNILYAIAF